MRTAPGFSVLCAKDKNTSWNSAPSIPRKRKLPGIQHPLYQGKENYLEFSALCNNDKILPGIQRPLYQEKDS